MPVNFAFKKAKTFVVEKTRCFPLLSLPWSCLLLDRVELDT